MWRSRTPRRRRSTRSTAARTRARTPKAKPPKPAPPPFVAATFWDTASGRDNPVGCWIWQGGTMPTGYGYVMKDGKLTLAHRVAWELTFGAAPERVRIWNQCGERRCINPYHWLTTNEQFERPATSCATPDCDNPITASGRRYCEACRSRNRRARAKAAGTLQPCRTPGCPNTSENTTKPGLCQHCRQAQRST